MLSYPIIEVDEDYSNSIEFTICQITGYKSPEIHYKTTICVDIDKEELKKLIEYKPRNHLEDMIKNYALQYNINESTIVLCEKYAPDNIIKSYKNLSGDIIFLDYVMGCDYKFPLRGYNGPLDDLLFRQTKYRHDEATFLFEE